MDKTPPLQALWISVLVTGAYPVAGKFAAGIISPSLLLLCSTAAAVLFWAPWVSKNKMWGAFFRRDTFLPFCMIGLMGTALPFLLIFIALQYTTPANAAILNQTEAVYSLLLTAVFLRERPTPKQLLGTALVIGGVSVILLGGKFSPQWKGDVIVLCTVWMFQISHIFAKKLPENLPPQLLSTGRALFAFVWSLPIALILYRFNFDISAFKPGWPLALLLFYMGVVNYAVGNAFWYKAIRSMDLSKATAVILCYPVVTYLLSALAGMDKFVLGRTAGLALALSGAYLITITIKKGNKNETNSV
jgi:drug/metabolite transporter (DMT)-like permease